MVLNTIYKNTVFVYIVILLKIIKHESHNTLTKGIQYQPNITYHILC